MKSIVIHVSKKVRPTCLATDVIFQITIKFILSRKGAITLIRLHRSKGWSVILLFTYASTVAGFSQ